MRRKIWNIGKWVLGAGLVVAVCWLNREKFAKIATQWDQFEPWHLVLAGLVFFIGTLMTFWRWLILVRAQELPFRYVDSVRLGFIGLFFSAFLPGAVGGDLVKAGFIAREQDRRTIAVATIMVDRILGLYGLLLLASIVGLLYWEQTNVVDDTGQAPLRVIVGFVWAITAGVLVAVALLAVFSIGSDRLIAKLEHGSRPARILADLLLAGQMYKNKLSAVALALLIAVVGHVFFVGSFYLAATAIPPPVPTLEQHGMLVPVGMVVESIPLTPGGLGIGEATYEYLYSLVDQHHQFEGKGILAKLGHRLVNWAIALLGLAFYLPLRRTMRRMEKQGEDDLLSNAKSTPENGNVSSRTGRARNRSPHEALSQ